MFPCIQALRHPQQYLYQIRCVAERKKSNQAPQKNSPHSALGYIVALELDITLGRYMVHNSSKTAYFQAQVYLSRYQNLI